MKNALCTHQGPELNLLRVACGQLNLDFPNRGGGHVFDPDHCYGLPPSIAGGAISRQIAVRNPIIIYERQRVLCGQGLFRSATSERVVRLRTFASLLAALERRIAAVCKPKAAELVRTCKAYKAANFSLCLRLMPKRLQDKGGWS